MRPGRKILLIVGLGAFVIAPLSVLLTVLLAPFWNWLEATTQVEAIGHSGPSAWCFALVFLLSAGIALPLILRLTKRPQGRTS